MFFCSQNTAYEMRISDWSSDVCSSDLNGDSVGVACSWEMPDLFHGITMDQIRSMQSMVGNGMWWENSQSAEWVGKAVADALLLDVKGDKKRISRMLKAWITEGALDRKSTRLNSSH